MVNTSRVVLDSGQSQIVSAGDTATSITVNSGGYQKVLWGGTVSGLLIESGGNFGGNAGATVTSAVNLNRTDGNSAFSIENGVASNMLVEYGAKFYVESGQSAVNTLVA